MPKRRTSDSQRRPLTTRRRFLTTGGTALTASDVSDADRRAQWVSA
jgi:hypothetical protein